jgi:GNAT superfamily N-acetyltransferase
MSYITVSLDLSKHDRATFLCGKSLLDNYFQKQASQDVKRNLSACFVLIDKNTDEISGYYTLSTNSIPQDQIPEIFKKKLPPSYMSIPTILLGRLAISLKYQRKGFGQLLLVDALKRCFDTSESIGAYAVVVDPLDFEAAQFYDKYGFIKLPDSGKLFLPITTIKVLFK